MRSRYEGQHGIMLYCLVCWKVEATGMSVGKTRLYMYTWVELAQCGLNISTGVFPCGVHLNIPYSAALRETGMPAGLPCLERIRRQAATRIACLDRLHLVTLRAQEEGGRRKTILQEIPHNAGNGVALAKGDLPPSCIHKLSFSLCCYTDWPLSASGPRRETRAPSSATARPTRMYSVEGPLSW
ncbi:hypothetical protein F5B17DRAFT_243625 [Nemania serpens]|nr:hypothetical protein F5B17DRAFT_243625 [Nemania serpens]